MSVTGFVVLGVFALFFIYLLPTVISSRQVVVDSRVDDRFSVDLRVVATAGHQPVVDRRDSSIRGYVHRQRTELPEASMDRPVAHHERLVAADARRAAAARAARAAAASRRAAAARRRLALTVLLLAVSAGAWVLVATGSIGPVLAAVPTILLGIVAVLGRRASARSAEAEARWRHDSARDATAVGRPAVDRSAAGSPVRVSRTAETEVTPRLRIDVDPAALLPEEPIRRHQGPELADGEGWTPVPVPVPTYTLKPTAPRRDVTPFVADEYVPESPAVPAGEQSSTGADDAADAAATSAPERSDAVDGHDAPAVRAVPVMNLQAVLERRRAVGQ